MADRDGSLVDVVNKEDSIQMTSIDARKFLAGLKEPTEDFPENIANMGRCHVVYSAIKRVVFDAQLRHITRAIYADALLPNYRSLVPFENEEFKKSFAQTFGFERQGLTLEEINAATIKEALITNMYAALDHIYWAFGALIDEPLNLMKNGVAPQNLQSLLQIMENYSATIMKTETKLSLFLPTDKITFISKEEYIDRSYRTDKHWDNFSEHFRMQHARVQKAMNQIGHNTVKEYSSLSNLLQRLDVYT